MGAEWRHPGSSRSDFSSCSALSGAASPALGQEPSPQPPAPAPSPGPGPHEKPPPWEVGARIQYEIDAWFAGLVRSALSSVLDLLGHTIFSTPGVDGHPRVVELWRLSAAVADAALILLVLAASGLVVVGDGLHLQMTGKELLARLLVAAASVNLSLALAGAAISLSNALAAGLHSAGNPFADG